MAAGDLKLTFGSLTVTINQWLSGEAPRAQPQIGGKISYTAKGNTLETGTSFELPYFWTISARVTEVERQIIGAMWARVDKSRRDLDSTSARTITLIDETERVEEATQTRTIAPSTSAITLVDGSVSYFAQFSVLMPDRPKFTKFPKTWAMVLTLNEVKG
jgi:hypothetical protein